MRLPRSFLVAGVIALSIVPRLVTAQAATPATRFPDPDHITGDPTGLVPDLTVRAAPRYPDDARKADRSATPVVAFVIDTAGRVELRSASFLNDPTPDFRRAICEMLPDLRFNPPVVGGQKLRVLLVQSYTFQTLRSEDTTYAAAQRLVQQSQERFATQPVTAVVPELDARAHCDSSGSR